MSVSGNDLAGPESAARPLCVRILYGSLVTSVSHAMGCPIMDHPNLEMRCAMRKKFPLQIDGWKANNSLVTILAKEAAVAADAVHGTLQMLHAGEEMAKFPPLPRIERWLALYRHHTQIQNVLVDGFFPSGNPAMKTSTVIATLLKAHRAFCRASNEQREAIIQRAPRKNRPNACGKASPRGCVLL